MYNVGLILTMLNIDIPCFKNSVDQDQLASQKSADQDLEFFFSLINNWIPES